MNDRSGELRPEHRRRFKKAIDELNALRSEIATYIPDAKGYLRERRRVRRRDRGQAPEDLNLMSGPSHAGHKESAQKQNVIESQKLWNSGGGDW